MLKKIIPVLSRLTKSVIPAFLIFNCGWLAVTSANDAVVLDKVIATVNQQRIFYSDLEEVCQQLALEGKVVDEALSMHVLRELVVNKIFLAKAILQDIKIPEADIQRECDLRIASLVQRLGSEKKLVDAAHKSMYHIKKSLRQRFESEYLASRVHEYLTKSVVVTPAEVKAYFNALPAAHRPYYSASVQVHQLVVYPKIHVARKEATQKKLLELKQLLLDGTATFAQLAKEYSQDPDSASKGGEIGWVPLGVLSPAYESAARSLKIGEISDPIASEFGFHIIELLGHNKGCYNTRHILQLLQPTEEEIRLAEVELNKIRAKIVSGALNFETAVQKYSEDRDSATKGGLMTSHHQRRDGLPGLLMPVESLDPEVYFAIDALEVGGVSKPQYMSGSSRPAWRLLYLKQRVVPHPMNLKDDYTKIHDIILHQKKKEAVDKWIKNAKSEFVITFSPEYEAVRALL